VAHGRRISSEEGEMRHGRKSRDRLIDGYKRHIPRDLDQGLVRGAPACGSGLSVAHAPEATVTKSIVADLAAQEATLSELYIDDEQIKDWSAPWTNSPRSRPQTHGGCPARTP
jgi:hypothetical protein